MWEVAKKRFHEFGRGWLGYECASMAAGVAFYAGLSLFPLMLVLIAGVGYFFRFVERGRDARDEILGTVSQQFSPQVGDALGTMLGRIQSGALVTGPLAAVMLLFTASVVFLHIDRGFNRIWDVRRRETAKGFASALKRMALGRLRSLTMLLGTGVVVLLVFVAGLLLRAGNAILREWFPDAVSLPGFGSLMVGLAVNTLVFFVLYRFLSKEPVAPRLCLAAGAGAAVLWEIGSRAMGAVSFGSGFSVYGVIGSFLVVQVWIYYSAMVLFAGAVAVRIATKPLPPEEEGGEPGEGRRMPAEAGAP